MAGQMGGPPPVNGQPKVTPSGLQYIDVVPGTGDEARAGQRVTVHYTGWLTNGQKFDSSRDRGRPLTFQLEGDLGLLLNYSAQHGGLSATSHLIQMTESAL